MNTTTKPTCKVFPLEDVLSSIYGILLCDIGKVYEFLNFVFNDTSLFTHQLPKAGRLAQPLIEAQYPFLSKIDLKGINPSNYKERLAAIKEVNPKHLEIVQIGEYNGELFADLNEIINKGEGQA